MLEDQIAVEISLVQRSVTPERQVGDEGVRLASQAERQQEGVLVPVDVLVDNLRRLVEREGERRRSPVAALIDENLTALERNLSSLGVKTHGGPNRIVATDLQDVRPEYGAGFMILWPLEQHRRIDHRHLVGIQHQHVLEVRVIERKGLELPSIPDGDALGGQPGERIDDYGRISDQPVVIKLNAQGSELHVLQGAARFLATHRHDIVVICEVSPGLLSDSGSSVEALVTLLASHHFAAAMINNGAQRIEPIGWDRFVTHMKDVGERYHDASEDIVVFRRPDGLMRQLFSLN